MTDEPVIDSRTAADEPVLNISEPTLVRPVVEPAAAAVAEHEDARESGVEAIDPRQQPAVTVQSVETPIGVHLVKFPVGMTEDEMRDAAQTGPKIYSAPVVVE